MTWSLFPSADRTGAQTLRTFLQELAFAGLNEGNLQRLAAAQARHWVYDGPIVFEAKDPGSTLCIVPSLNLLIRLFQEGGSVPSAELDALFSPGSLRFLEGSGMVARAGATTTANVTLACWRGMVTAADRFDRGAWDDVYIPNRATGRIEAYVPPLARGARGLDLGTGNGALALLQAAHGIRVTAVDPNPRAIEFAKFNAKLNGVEIAELYVGDNSVLSTSQDHDIILFNMPAIYFQSDILYSAYQDPDKGLQVLRDTYRMVGGALGKGGIAALRHELRVDWLNARDLLEQTHAPDDLQILYMHPDPDDDGDRNVRAGGLGRDDLAASLVFGMALVRARPSRSAPHIQFAPMPYEEVKNYSAQRLWDRVLSFPDWRDVFTAQRR